MSLFICLRQTLREAFHKPFSKGDSGGAMLSAILISVPLLVIVMAVSSKSTNLSKSNWATRVGEVGAQNNEVAASILASLIDAGTIKYDQAAKRYVLASGVVPPLDWTFIASNPAKLEIYLCPSSNSLLPKIIAAKSPPTLVVGRKCSIGGFNSQYEPVKVSATLADPLPSCKVAAEMSSVSANGQVKNYSVRISRKNEKNWGPQAGRFISDGLYRDCEGPRQMGIQVETCPEGMAAFSLQDSEEVVVHCGVLPKSDMLSSNPAELNIRRANGNCLANEVITGAEWVSLGVQPPTDSYVLCSKINTARYQLGSRKVSGYFYWGSSAASSGKKGASVTMAASNLPGQIRYLMGRKYYPNAPVPSMTDWDPDGCFGYDVAASGDNRFGLLMVSKEYVPNDNVTSKYCGDMTAVHVEYKGISGDPAAGTIVDMFPEKCSDITDQGKVFDGKCIP